MVSVYFQHAVRSFLFARRLLSASFRALPDFIIVGAQKAGTTSLWSYLGQHPNIKVSPAKEVNYFDNNYHKSVLWYRAHFHLSNNKTNFIYGEASPDYLPHPHVTQRIHKLLPSVKLIILLRNPVHRAISHYYHKIRRGIESLPIMVALQIEEERLKNEWDKMLENESYFSYALFHFAYKHRGIYVEQLKRYFQYFSKEQILIMDCEELFDQPEKTLKKVFGFLGVESKLATNINTIPENVYPDKKVIPPEVYRYLDQYFVQYNQELYEYLGRDFKW